MKAQKHQNFPLKTPCQCTKKQVKGSERKKDQVNKLGRRSTGSNYSLVRIKLFLRKDKKGIYRGYVFCFLEYGVCISFIKEGEGGKEPQRTTLPCFTTNIIRVELTEPIQIGEYVQQNCTLPRFTDTANRAKLTKLNLFLV